MKFFLETNILVDADDKGGGFRHEASVDFIDKAMKLGQGAISTQVLQEGVVTAARNLEIWMNSSTARLSSEINENTDF